MQTKSLFGEIFYSPAEEYAPSDESPETPMDDMSVSPSRCKSATPEPPLYNKVNNHWTNIEPLPIKQQQCTPNPIYSINDHKEMEEDDCNHTVIDLCDDTENEQSDTFHSKSHTNSILHQIQNEHNIKCNDFEDKEVSLWGISIGTHSHHWTTTSQQKRSKLIFNKHKSSFDIYIKSTAKHYVKITIKQSNISMLIIPKDPSLFQYKQPVGQYLNCFFLKLKQPLSQYKWLSNHFNPSQTQQPQKTFISVVIDAPSFHQFASIALSTFKCNLIDHITVIQLNIHTHINLVQGQYTKT